MNSVCVIAFEDMLDGNVGKWVVSSEAEGCDKACEQEGLSASSRVQWMVSRIIAETNNIYSDIAIRQGKSSCTQFTESNSAAVPFNDSGKADCFHSP